MLLRLNRYYKHIGNFDFLDKTLQKVSKNQNQFKLTSYVIAELPLDKFFLKKLLVLEFLVNQKIRLNYGLKSCKLSFFNLTLRNINYFLFLETCLNSVFLIDPTVKVHKIKQIQGPNFYVPNSFVHDFNLLSVTNPVLFVNSFNSITFKSFYFIF